MKPIACGSKEFNLPLSRFPLAGASRGHHRLRCAAARAQHRPKAKRSSAFWAGKEEMLCSWGPTPPNPRSPWDGGNYELYATNRTFHLLIKPDNLTCYQQAHSKVCC